MTKRAVLSVATWLCVGVFTIGMGVDAKRAAAQDAGYHWVNVTNNAAYAPRDGAGALVYDDKMWLLGGWHPGHPDFPRDCNNEVWNSTNGADWTLVKPNTFDDFYIPGTDWEGRHTAGYVVHQDKMWIVGGDPLQDHYQPDVWNSTNGVDWTQVTPSAPWGQRVLHHTLEFDNKIWVMGGQTLAEYVPGSPTAFYNDVWNTTDGVYWTQVTASAQWSPRGMIGNNVVFNDRMWILGGGTYNTSGYPRNYYNDVWSSADGVNWTQHLDSAPWDPRQYHEVAVFDNKMWVMEGYNGNLGGNRKDVWYSENGVDWTEVPNTPWNPRHAASVYTYDDALWMVAGNNMQKDVWKLVRNGTEPDPPPSYNPSGVLVVTDTSEVRLYSRDLTSMTASMSPGGTVTGAKFLKNGNLVVSNNAGQLGLYSGKDLSPIGSASTFAEGVSNIVPLANGNFAVAAHSADPGTNYGVWIYDGTTGAPIGQNVNWQAPVTHVIETTHGNVAFAVDPAGDGGGSVVVLNGTTGGALGWTQGWGNVEKMLALANADGDVLITATEDHSNTTPGGPFLNTWATIDGATGVYQYSNPNWDHVPTVAGTANGEIVWNGVYDYGSGPVSQLFRYSAEGALLASNTNFAKEPMEQIVELANGNLAFSFMYDHGGGLRGEVWIFEGDLSPYLGSNKNWDEAPFIAAVPNANGDLLMQGNYTPPDPPGGAVWHNVYLWDGEGNMIGNALIASQSGGVPDIADLIALDNGNVFFSTSGGAEGQGKVFLLTSGTEEETGPRFLIDTGSLAAPLIAGGLEDNYIYHAGESGTGGLWFLWAGTGTDVPYDVGGFTEDGGAPLFLDYYYNSLLFGDANDDGFVDSKDASILGAHWLQSGTEIGWAEGDFNADHVVNDKDAAILAAHWSPAGALAEVPEPSSAALLLGLFFGALALHRRRMNLGRSRATLGTRR